MSNLQSLIEDLKRVYFRATKKFNTDKIIVYMNPFPTDRPITTTIRRRLDIIKERNASLERRLDDGVFIDGSTTLDSLKQAEERKLSELIKQSNELKSCVDRLKNDFESLIKEEEIRINNQIRRGRELTYGVRDHLKLSDEVKKRCHLTNAIFEFEDIISEHDVQLNGESVNGKTALYNACLLLDLRSQMNNNDFQRIKDHVANNLSTAYHSRIMGMIVEKMRGV